MDEQEQEQAVEEQTAEPSPDGGEQKEIRTESAVQDTAARQNKGQIRAEQAEFLRANAPFIAQIGNLVYQVGDQGADGRAADQTVRFAQVPPGEIGRVSAVYERPSGYDNAAEQLKQDHLLILQGPAHVGKRATAIYLAFDLRGSNLSLHQLSPEIELEQVSGDLLSDGCVYLVDGLVASRAGSLREYAWRSLGSALRDKGSYLIICARPEIRFDAELPRSGIYPIAAPQIEPGSLLRRHLRHEGIAADEIDALLGEPEISGLLQRPLLPPEIYQLARDLLPHFHEGATLQTALRGFEAYAATAVEDWFEQCGDDMEKRAFRIALAVFSGARYTAVQEAANQLAERLKPAEPEPKKKKKKKEKPPPSPFALRKSSELDQANAYLTKAYVRTEYSDQSEVEVVKLKDESYQPAFLRYLWLEYPDFRADLLAWLREYGRHPQFDMRGRAAAAVSFLAQLDFGLIRAEILYPWAHAAFQENERRYRAALSDAFGALIWDDVRANDVLGLLHHWMKQENMALVWAAVRAYGRVGIRYPREAMEQWQKMLVIIFDNLGISAALTLVHRPEQERLVNLSRLFDSLMDAILSFLVAPLTWPPEQFQQVYEQVLASLRDWVDQEDKPVMADHIGLPLFLLLASLRVTPDEGGEKEREEKYPPALLLLASGYAPGDETVRNLAWLLGKGLRHQPTREESLNVLEGWLRYVDQHDQKKALKPALLNTLQALLAAPPFARERWRGLLATRLRRWANLPRQPIPLADELLDALRLRRQLK